MKSYCLIIILVFSLSCKTEGGKTMGRIDYLEFNTTSASKVLELAGMIQEGQNINALQWQELFKTDGYRNYLIYSDSLRKKELIKEVMLTVFNEDNQTTLDSLLSLPVEMNSNYFKLSLVNNFYAIKTNFHAYKAFLESLDSEKVIKEADSLAKLYIPKRHKSSLPKLYPVFMVSADADGQVMDNAIVIDLSLTYQSDHEGVVKFIAHEFHHNYRMLKSKQYESPLMIKLNGIQQEGIADLIDKEKPPLESLLSLPKSLVDAYNQDYLKATENLKKLDSVSQLYFEKKMDDLELKKQLNGIVGFGGHTLGIYMSFLINERLGKEIMIETYDNPIRFFEIYNEVAIDVPDAHVFSNDFMEQIKELK